MNQEKKVDESWKHAVEKEKQAPAQSKAQAPSSESEFLAFVSTLAMQALIAMGDVEHPQTGRSAVNLAQSQYLIDIIQMLSDKTKGNLSKEEAREMETLLYELRVKFVKKNQELPA